LNDYWPTGTHGSVLLTSRNQHLRQAPIINSIALKCFQPEEGIKYLLDNIPQAAKLSADANKDATKIFEACGGLPLALSQVARYIQSLNITVADATKLVPSSDALVSPDSEINTLTQPDYYHRLGTSKLWESSIHALSNDSKSLGHFLAHLDPDAISDKLFKDTSVATIHDHFGGAAK
jgi:hypothetical protein